MNHLAHAINGLIAGRRLTQVTAAERLGIGSTQTRVSSLANDKLDGLSVGRLMTLLTALDRDVEIVIRNKPCSRRLLVAASGERGREWLAIPASGVPLRPFQTIA